MSSQRSVVVAFAILFALHALVTAVHFAMILSGSLAIHGSYGAAVEFAVADTCSAIIPSLIATVGLLRGRRWGLVAAFVASGSTLHGMLVLLVRAARDTGFTVMAGVAIYFVVFAVTAVLVLGRLRVTPEP